MQVLDSLFVDQMSLGVNMQLFHDIRFQFNSTEEEEKEVLFAHKSILSNSCQYFRVLFCGAGKDMAEGKGDVIELPDYVEKETFRYLLIYLYTGELPVADDDDVESDDNAEEELTDKGIYFHLFLPISLSLAHTQ